MGGIFDSVPSRRMVLAGGAALVAVHAPKVAAQAKAPAKWRRYNVASAEGQMMLGHYQTAIAAMLKLPPSDPRSWYRTALVHYLDCPHGNWWLFPWHRALTGWTEQIVRKMSGFEAFAFPYWDWTANPSVPAAMYQGLFNPSNPAFFPNAKAFGAAYQGAYAKTNYWAPGSVSLAQLTERGVPSEAAMWDQIVNPATPDDAAFYPSPMRPNTRNPVAALGDCMVGPAVSAKILTAAMAPQDYETFSSPKSANLGDNKGFALLEKYPHNKVHNYTGGVTYQAQGGQCVVAGNSGGFMQAFLSPSDPLFFLHHSNIDRLWDAWTERQKRDGLPYVPQDPGDFKAWSDEQFLFFSDADGKPVTKTRSGDYIAIGDFAYDYQPGSVGTSSSSPLLEAVKKRAPVQRFPGTAKSAALTATTAMRTDTVRVAAPLVQLARPGGTQHLLAKITLVLPHAPRGTEFPVFIDTGSGAPLQVGTVGLFGHTMAHGPMTFTLPLDDALAALRGKGMLKAGGALTFKAGAATQDIPVLAVTIEAH